MPKSLAAQFTETELEGLSPEELAGLTDDSITDDVPYAEVPEFVDTDDGGRTGGGTIEDEDADTSGARKEPDDAGAGEDVEKTSDELAAERQAADDEAAAAAALAAASETPAVDDARPKTVKAPEDLKDKLEALRQQQDELDEKFDNGDITAAERRTQDRALQEQIDDLKAVGNRAQHSAQDAQDYWFNRTVASFLARPDAALYATASGNTLLDQKVRELQVGEFAADPFDPQILEKAHAAIMKDLGREVPATPASRKAPAGEERRIPPAIGEMPSAGDENLAGSAALFARLDKLDGVAYEQELEKLPADVRNRYLANG